MKYGAYIPLIWSETSTKALGTNHVRADILKTQTWCSDTFNIKSITKIDILIILYRPNNKLLFRYRKNTHYEKDKLVCLGTACAGKTPQERGGQTSAFCSAQTDSYQQEPSNHQRKETAPPPRNPYLWAIAALAAAVSLPDFPVERTPAMFAATSNCILHTSRHSWRIRRHTIIGITLKY